MGDRDLRGAQHMARGMEHDRDTAQPDLLSIGHRLRRAREIISVAQPHDVERFRRRQHRPMAGPGMIRMAVGDDRAVHGPHRINVEAAGLAVQSGGIKHQNVVRSHERHISGRLYCSSLGSPIDAGTRTGVDASSRRRWERRRSVGRTKKGRIPDGRRARGASSPILKYSPILLVDENSRILPLIRKAGRFSLFFQTACPD